MTRFAYTSTCMQNLSTRKLKALASARSKFSDFCMRVNFAYMSKCGHMDRFVYVRKFFINANFVKIRL